MTTKAHLSAVEGTKPRIVPHHFSHSWRFRVTKAIRNFRDNARRAAFEETLYAMDTLSGQLNQHVHALYDEIRLHLDCETRERHNNLHGKKHAVFHSSRNQMDAYARALVGQHLLQRVERGFGAMPSQEQDAMNELLKVLQAKQEECVYQKRDALLERVEAKLCEKGERSLHGRMESLNFLRTVESFIDKRFSEIPFVAVRFAPPSL